MSKKSFISGFINGWKEACAEAKAKLGADPDFPRREFIRKRWSLLILIFVFLFVPAADLTAKAFQVSKASLVVADYSAMMLAVYLAYLLTISEANKKFGRKK